MAKSSRKSRAPRPPASVQRKPPQRDRRRLYVLAAVAAAVLVAAIAAAVTAGGDDGGADAETDTAALLEGIPQDGTFLGSPDAPVTLAEYADLQCPFCRDWAVSTFPALVEEYVRPGRLRLEFRGLDFIGPESTAALRGALAAGEQDRLWNVVHRLYEEQGPENGGWVTDDLLRRIGGEIDGLDVDRMMNDRDSGAVTAAMREADEQFGAAGLRGTPSFEVGTTGGDLRVIEVTSLEPESFRPIIDEELESAS